MLSVAALAQGPGYYLELANINYYAEGGEPLPLWHGTAAKELGLSGIAKREHVERLCSGYHHETEKAVVRNAGTPERNPGHDLTFSCPKSVSVAWAMADTPLRKAIEIKHQEAVKEALDFLEAKAGYARTGKQGQEVVRASLLFALFEHGTSRAMDPQLHTHAICINLTVHPDGRMTAIDSTHLYHLKMAGGAMYRAALARGMQELGFAIEQKRIGSSIGFELSAVPTSLIEEFSKRRAEIEEQLRIRAGSLDAASPKYAEMVAKETRRTKDTEKARKELLEGWKEVGREHGVTADYLYSTREPLGRISPEERGRRREEIFREAIGALSEQHSHWNEADLTKAVAERSAGRISAGDVRSLIEEKLTGPELVRLGRLTTAGKSQNPNRYIDRTEERFTTPEIVQLERQMLRNVERIVSGPQSGVRDQLIEKTIGKSPRPLDAEQAKAVHWLCGGPGIGLMSGIAGAGKTTTIQTCHEIWKAEEKEVLGCAVAGRAAKQLQRETGIQSRTLESLLWNLDNGRIQLTARAVVVMDEAGMCGTKHMARLVEHVANAPGARLVLLGDAKQLQPITAGGPFKYLAGVVGEAKLENIRRQEAKWARDAVKDFQQGRAREAIAAFVEHGRFHLADSRPQAMAQLVERWKQDGGLSRPGSVLMLASLNSEVKELNLRAQAERIRAGEVNAERKIHANGVNFHEGDRLQFGKKSTELGIENADTATVLRVNPPQKRLSVRHDDDGRIIEVSLKRYSPEKLRLGYASTTHKAQGATIEHVHVLMGGPLTDNHMGYVQASRSRKSTHLFCDKDTAGGPELSDLTRALSRENQKTMAQEVQERASRQEPSPRLDRAPSPALSPSPSLGPSLGPSLSP